MAYETLLTKAQNNFETADWAEQKTYYNTSISRYYYCLYEKAIVIAMKNDFYAIPPGGKNSHYDFIINFQKNVKNQLTTSEITLLSAFVKLKDLRIEADYKNKCSIENKNQYNLIFKYSFNQINSIMEKLLKSKSSKS